MEGKGTFYAPTIVTDVTPQIPLFNKETGGSGVIRARDTEHAIRDSERF